VASARPGWKVALSALLGFDQSVKTNSGLNIGYTWGLENTFQHPELVLYIGFHSSQAVATV